MAAAPQGSPLPCATDARPSCPSQPLCTALDAEHTVAEGAAIEAARRHGVSSERLADLLMLDVLPRSIGLAAADGSFVRMLERDSKLPVEVSKVFSTATKGQPAVTVEVYEGDSDKAVKNAWLGHFNFPVYDPDGAEAGERQVKVKFEAEESGLVRVVGVPLRPDGTEVEVDEMGRVKPSSTTLWILVGYVALLFLMYVYFKAFLFREAHIEQYRDWASGEPMPSAAEMSTADAGGAEDRCASGECGMGDA